MQQLESLILVLRVYHFYLQEAVKPASKRVNPMGASRADLRTSSAADYGGKHPVSRYGFRGASAANLRASSAADLGGGANHELVSSVCVSLCARACCATCGSKVRPALCARQGLWTRSTLVPEAKVRARMHTGPDSKVPLGT
eukprot:1149064-Pelagomonas_calceolata.AAC.8